MPAPKSASGTEPKKNDKRIAEAIELRRQNQKDQNDGKTEDRAKLTAFDSELTRAAGVIGDEPAGMIFCASVSRNFSAVSTEAAGTPLIVTALSCCMRLRDRATVVCLIDAIVLRRTS